MITWINLCVKGCPLPPYIKDQGEEAGRPSMARQGGVLLLVGVGLLLGGGKGSGEGEGKGGAAPPLLVQFGPGGGGARPTLVAPLSLSTKAHMAHYFSRGGSGNPPALRFSPKSPGTLPVSEYSRPIYQSLCLDHFETPHHVHHHIRDSELTSVHQNS